jgi:hypothetical protein
MRLKKFEGIPLDKNLDLVFSISNVIFSLSPVLCAKCHSKHHDKN